MRRTLGLAALGVFAILAVSGLALAQPVASRSRVQAVAQAEAALDQAERGRLPASIVAAARAHGDACAQAWGAQAIETTRCRLRLGEALTDNEDNAEAIAVLSDVIARLAGAGSAEVERLARAQSALGEALRNASRYAESETALTAALQVQQARFGDAHLDTFRTLRRLASLRVFQVRLADAEAALARAEAAAARIDIPAGERALILVARGRIADRSGHWDEAERLLRQALALMDQAYQPDDPRRGPALTTLSLVLRTWTGQMDEAEAVARRILEIEERAYGPLDPRVGTSLNNMANILMFLGRTDEAEALLRRAVALAEAAQGPQSLVLAIRLFNHAFALDVLGRAGEAEALLRRAIDIYAQSAPNDPNRSRPLLGLAMLRQTAGDLSAAQSLAQQALEIRRAAFGETHFLTIESLRALGGVQLASGQAERAEATLRTAALRADEVAGPDSFDAIMARSRLSVALLALGRTEEAWDEAFAGMRRLRMSIRPDLTRDKKGGAYAAIEQVLSVAAKSPPREGAEREAVFDMMQLASRSPTGVATARTALRLAESDHELARLDERVRTLRVRTSALERESAQAYGRGDTQAIREHGAALAAERAALAAAQQELSDRNPLFADFAGRLSTRLADLSGDGGVLRRGEGLLLAAQTTESLHLLLVTRDRMRFESVALTRAEAARIVARLRTSLRLEAALSPSDLPEFDLAAAHDLYRRIIAPFRREMRGVDMLYVAPDGPLASIPFSLLVAEAAPPQADQFERYRRTRFLSDETGLATLPSPAALVAARRHVRPSRAQEMLVAFADPALAGTEDVRTLTRWASLRNGVSAATVSARNAAAVCRMRPLPDARREALAIAERIGAGSDDVFLGRAATERTLHELNASGALAQRRIVLFATHGLVSGEDTGAVEPALVLTPPDGCASSVESDDGLLTASEIATLTFDADWVILSGCNTAAPDGSAGAAPFSGLARAFLYAGARRLLVSHWSVDSEAAADLTSALFDPRNRDLIPAAALRQAMRSMRESRGAQAYRAHPAFWAPFVLVGDGR